MDNLSNVGLATALMTDPGDLDPQAIHQASPWFKCGIPSKRKSADVAKRRERNKAARKARRRNRK